MLNASSMAGVNGSASCSDPFDRRGGAPVRGLRALGLACLRAGGVLLILPAGVRAKAWSGAVNE